MKTPEQLDLASRIVRLARTPDAIFLLGRTLALADMVRTFEEARHGAQGAFLTALSLLDAVDARSRLGDLTRVLDMLEAQTLRRETSP